MPAYIDYSGKKIGRVRVLEEIQRNPKTRWKCLCDCGKEFVSLSLSFKRGNTFECNPCRFERRRGIDLTGRKFGRWTVIERRIGESGHTFWYVKCDCGKNGLVATNVLGKKGRSMSCGCLGRKEKSKYANETLYPPEHLTSKKKIYNVRSRILHACYNEKSQFYKKYGPKGITVCELWRNGAKDFFEWCIENGWKEGSVLHLKENCLEFSPENCKVIPQEENQRIQLAKKIIIKGKELNVYEWSKISGILPLTILDRLSKGYSEEESVFCKLHKNSGKKKWPDEEIKALYESGLSLADVGRKLAKSYTAISKRLKLMGIKVDQTSFRRKYKERICKNCYKEFQPKGTKQKICIECKAALHNEIH